jgi:hypothetical protein
MNYTLLNNKPSWSSASISENLQINDDRSNISAMLLSMKNMLSRTHVYEKVISWASRDSFILKGKQQDKKKSLTPCCAAILPSGTRWQYCEHTSPRSFILFSWYSKVKQSLVFLRTLITKKKGNVCSKRVCLLSYLNAFFQILNIISQWSTVHLL